MFEISRDILILTHSIALDAEPVCDPFNRVGRDTGRGRELPLSVQGVGGSHWQLVVTSNYNKSIMLIPGLRKRDETVLIMQTNGFNSVHW